MGAVVFRTAVATVLTVSAIAHVLNGTGDLASHAQAFLAGVTWFSLIAQNLIERATHPVNENSGAADDGPAATP